jgi:F plasmid transfer operon, TraF, protein
MNYPLARVVVAVAVVALPHTSSAQSIDALGTRPAGMGGAFVAVVDDASAVYWNPGALATGSYFSLSVDRTQGRTDTSEPAAGSRSGLLITLAAPVVGLSYYRLRATTLTPPDPPTDASQLGRNLVKPGQVRFDSLVTHHVGATVVQSLWDGIAAGATLKLVRGTAASGIVRDADRGVLLADGVDLMDEATTRFDADLGVLVSSGSLRAGLTVRNLTEPSFETGAGGRLKLERQARAGAAFVAAGWTVAADFDLLKSTGPHGETRDIAVGTEGRVMKRAVVRSGLRFNTLNTPSLGWAPAVSAGGSYAVRASFLVDAQITGGSQKSTRGWGIAGRFVY